MGVADAVTAVLEAEVMGGVVHTATAVAAVATVGAEAQVTMVMAAGVMTQVESVHLELCVVPHQQPRTQQQSHDRQGLVIAAGMTKVMEVAVVWAVAEAHRCRAEATEVTVVAQEIGAAPRAQTSRVRENGAWG